MTAAARRLASLPAASVIAAFVFAAAALAQDPGVPAPPRPSEPAPSPAAPAEGTDWRKEVDRACTSPRYGLRLAAARKVAAAGDAAVPAIRAFAKEKGNDAIPVALVEALADQGGNGDAVVGLLAEWAADVTFFWRAQALRGLAARKLPRSEPLFEKHANDPAWLVRVWSAAGRCDPRRGILDPALRQALADPDPRARTKFAAWLLGKGSTKGLLELIEALHDERTFLGDPWGRRRATEAWTALKSWLGGEDHGYRPEGPGAGGGTDEERAAQVEARGRFVRAVLDKHPLHVPASALHDDDRPFAGGIEVLSCRHGDFFLRFTANGLIVEGLAGGRELQVPETAWAKLEAERAALQLQPSLGVVICDSIRLRWSTPDVHAKAAPGSLTAAAAEWLQRLAAAIEDAGDRATAQALRIRLEQFAQH